MPIMSYSQILGRDRLVVMGTLFLTIPSPHVFADYSEMADEIY